MVDNPFSKYKNKLFIDWGRAAVRWYQQATNEKIITRILNTDNHIFPGYEQVILSYSELENIINNSAEYMNWHTALTSINAIYAITDCSNGKIYIGSSYNKAGILGRWTDYIQTKHGGNKGLIDRLETNSKAYIHFQYTILKVLPRDITAIEAVEIEQLYKRKFKTIEFGYNNN